MNFIRQNIIGAITISSLVVFSIFISQFLSSKDILISSAFMCIFLGLVLGIVGFFFFVSAAKGTSSINTKPKKELD